MFWLQRIRNSLSHQILFVVLVISFIGSFIITMFQVVRDYKQQVDTTQQSLRLINQSYNKSIANSLWNIDQAQMNAQLEGIVSLPSVDYIEVIEPGQESIKKGTKPHKSIEESFQLVYLADGKENDLGKLVLFTDMNTIYQSVGTKALVTIFSQLFKTMLVSICILIFINKLLTRHLVSIKNYLENIDLSKTPTLLQLERAKILEPNHDEITILVNSINQMAKDLYNYAENLENIVEERTQQLNETNRNIQKILQNIQQGIFTFAADLKIQKDFSSHLTRIMNQEKIADENAIDFLLAKSDINSNDKSQIAASLSACINDSYVSFELNSHLLPNEIEFHEKDSIKTLEIEWDAIIGEQDTIEKIMVVVKDVTELRDLQEKAKSQEQELVMMSEIMKIKPHLFEQFYFSSQKNIKQNLELIEKKDIDKEKANLLLRNMHTLKGNARTYGLSFAADEIHKAEHNYSEILKNSEIVYEKLRSGANDVRDILTRYYEIAAQNLAQGRSEGSKIHENQLVELINELRHAQASKSMALFDKIIAELDEKCQKFKYKNLSSIVHHVAASLDNEARNLGKSEPKITIYDNQIEFLETTHNALNDSIMHCMVNSLDHGIENIEERHKKGKSTQGHITIEVRQDGDHIYIIYEDDGRGVDLKRLKKIGIERNIISENASNDEIAKVMFHSGISTKTEVTKLSGRGVGMSAVVEDLEQLGGKISLVLGKVEKDNLGDEWIHFKLLISLPASLTRQAKAVTQEKIA